MSELKYKVGDKVRIKDIGWYNENKDKNGIIICGMMPFCGYMSCHCGKIVTISEILEFGYCIEEDCGENGWTDEMIDCLVERNGKTYPYKIGDRVVLKGNNRCATITDLKYNSWGNLSYYIKIDNDKDISTDYPTDLLLPYDNKIKGFLEDETIPKFKVGDKITNGNVTLTILSLLSDRYVVEDTFRKCGTLYFNSQDEWKLVEEKVELIDNLCKWVDEYILPDGYQFKDENGNIVYAKKIVLEKKKNEYPKTYEECCDKINFKGGFKEILLSDDEYSLYIPFIKLKRCRDAYWKIAGEEMGLGKPWEPTNETVYCISRSNNVIKSSYRGGKSNTLEFPTPEMRDAFYENFKFDIEQCKELL